MRLADSVFGCAQHTLQGDGENLLTPDEDWTVRLRRVLLATSSFLQAC